jgi:hypothetical protein
VQRAFPENGGAEIALGSRVRIQLGWTCVHAWYSLPSSRASEVS